MKRFLLILAFVLFCLTSSVQAKTFKVVSLQFFSTQFPLDIYNIETLERVNLGNGTILEPGTVVAGRVIEITRPRRGKRNAYFDFMPIATRYNGETKRLNNAPLVQINGYRKIDPEQAAIYVAKKLPNLLLMGSSLGISFVEGMMNAEEGERLKAGMTKTYKDTPLSLIDAGSHLNIEIGDTLKLKVKE